MAKQTVTVNKGTPVNLSPDGWKGEKPFLILRYFHDPQAGGATAITTGLPGVPWTAWNPATKPKTLTQELVSAKIKVSWTLTETDRGLVASAVVESPSELIAR